MKRYFGNNTTRRFPRSLDDAFPAERANPIVGYRRKRFLRRITAVVVILICAALVAALFRN